MTFGSLKLDLDELKHSEVISFLVERGVISLIPILKLNNESLKSFLSQFESSNKAKVEDEIKYKEIRFLASENEMETVEVLLNPYRDDFYFYLVKKYEKAISIGMLNYKIRSNEEFLGLDNIDSQKKIDLKYFKEYFNEINQDQSLQTETDEISGNSKMESYFTFLRRKRESYCEKLIYEKEMLINFLNGNGSYFDGHLININPLLNEIIRFESKIKVLVFLNSKHNFQENAFFTLVPHLDNIYFKYKNILFISPIAVEFTTYFLKNRNEVNLAEISCLFHVLKEFKSMQKSKKLFAEFLNENFKLPFVVAEIRNPLKSNNHIDLDRIAQYKADFDNYIESSRGQIIDPS